MVSYKFRYIQSHLFHSDCRDRHHGLAADVPDALPGTVVVSFGVGFQVWDLNDGEVMSEWGFPEGAGANHSIMTAIPGSPFLFLVTALPPAVHILNVLDGKVACRLDWGEGYAGAHRGMYIPTSSHVSADGHSAVVGGFYVREASNSIKYWDLEWEYTV